MKWKVTYNGVYLGIWEESQRWQIIKEHLTNTNESLDPTKAAFELVIE